jgi:hypothetical protein
MKRVRGNKKGKRGGAKMTLDEAKSRLKGYIKKYYCEVREDVFDEKSFKRELWGYVVSLSHDIAKMPGWQGHNWRQALRRHLYSFALNERDKIDSRKKVKKILRKILTFGLAKGSS